MIENQCAATTRDIDAGGGGECGESLCVLDTSTAAIYCRDRQGSSKLVQVKGIASTRRQVKFLDQHAPLYLPKKQEDLIFYAWMIGGTILVKMGLIGEPVN